MDFSRHNKGMQSNEEGCGYYATMKKDHKLSFTYEAIAKAAGSEAMKTYSNRLRETGEKPSYPFMKDRLTSLAGGIVDKLIDKKDLDEIDATKAKEMASQEAHRIADEKYTFTTAPGCV